MTGIQILPHVSDRGRPLMAQTLPNDVAEHTLPARSAAQEADADLPAWPAAARDGRG